MHKANQKTQVRRILLMDYDSELASITCNFADTISVIQFVSNWGHYHDYT